MVAEKFIGMGGMRMNPVVWRGAEFGMAISGTNEIH